MTSEQEKIEQFAREAGLPENEAADFALVAARLGHDLEAVKAHVDAAEVTGETPDGV